MKLFQQPANGIISTVVGPGNGSLGDGGPAINASVRLPSGIFVDASSNLFIAGFEDNRIRKVDSSGIITTVAGDGPSGVVYSSSANYSGDGGAATNAGLSNPIAVAEDSSGNLFIADSADNRIRKVSSTQRPSFSLNNMTAANAGDYSVVVSDASGSVTSLVATLTVNLSPLALGVISNAVRVSMTGAPGRSYVLQMATNLTPPVDWQPMVTNPAALNSLCVFTNAKISAVPPGFYRAMTQ